MGGNEILLPSPLIELQEDLLERRRVRLFIKRDDLINPHISGNKWRKLKYNLQEARRSGYDTILTFGGPYSNHILATATAGKLLNFKTIGVIRGEAPEPLNHCLAFVLKQGMALHYLSRKDYRQKYAPEILSELEKKYGAFYLLPEGGSNSLAVKGCAEIVDEIETPFDYLTCSVGTGGTLAGLIAGAPYRKVLGFSALKGGAFLENDVKKLLADYSGKSYSNWAIQTDYHFGGYAKTTPELLDFMQNFQRRHGIALDYVYTGKEMFGLYDLINKGWFEPGSRIIMTHTGGLFNASLGMRQ